MELCSAAVKASALRADRACVSARPRALTAASAQLRSLHLRDGQQELGPLSQMVEFDWDFKGRYSADISPVSHDTPSASPRGMRSAFRSALQSSDRTLPHNTTCC